MATVNETFESGTIPASMSTGASALGVVGINSVSPLFGAYDVLCTVNFNNPPTTDFVAENAYLLTNLSNYTSPDLNLSFDVKFLNALPKGYSYWNLVQCWLGGTNFITVRVASHDPDPSVATFVIINGVTGFTDTTVLEPNRTYHIQLHLKRSTGADGIIELWIDGALVISQTGLGESLVSTGNWNSVLFGFVHNALSPYDTNRGSQSLQIDNITITDTTPVMPYTLIVLPSIGNGTILPSVGTWKAPDIADYVWLIARPDAGLFAHFVIDGVEYPAQYVEPDGDYTYYLHMDKDHTIQAIFNTTPPPTPDGGWLVPALLGVTGLLVVVTVVAVGKGKKKKGRKRKKKGRKRR